MAGEGTRLHFTDGGHLDVGEPPNAVVKVLRTADTARFPALTSSADGGQVHVNSEHVLWFEKIPEPGELKVAIESSDPDAPREL